MVTSDMNNNGLRRQFAISDEIDFEVKATYKGFSITINGDSVSPMKLSVTSDYFTYNGFMDGIYISSINSVIENAKRIVDEINRN